MAKIKNDKGFYGQLATKDKFLNVQTIGTEVQAAAHNKMHNQWRGSV